MLLDLTGGRGKRRGVMRVWEEREEGKQVQRRGNIVIKEGKGERGDEEG